MSGSLVEDLTRQIDPRNHSAGRTALTGAAQVIALGAKRRTVRLWPDPGSSDVHWRINPDGTTTAAADTDPKISDVDGIGRTFTEPISFLYIYSAGSDGALNHHAS